MTSSEPSPRDRRRALPPHLAASVVLVLTVLAFFVAIITVSLDRHKMSVVDEHVHLDYALRIHDGVVPYRGLPYSDALITEWACGVGHEAGDIAYPCGSPALSPDVLPSGRWSTAYIHYPTFFLAADGWRRGLDAAGTGVESVSAYRSFSAALMIAGVLVCAAGAWRAGVRGSRLIIATLVPVAASAIALLGTLVNPASAAPLQGALVAIAGVRWMMTGRGFWWLLAAAAFASGTAVTDSLPVGAFMLAAVVVLVAGRRVCIDSPWRPRWWHVGALAAVVLIPVLVWGRIIAARAVVSNETLYAFAARGDTMSVASGVVRELTSFHLPWIDTAEFPGAGFFMVLRSASSGLTPWVGLLVAAVLVLVALRTMRPRPLEDPAGPAAEVQGDDEQGTQVLRAVGGATTTLQPLVLLAATTVLTIVLYPPALRLANALNFGFDFPIVSRYTVSFAPMMALLVALLVPGKALPRLLAGVAVVVVLGLSFSWV